MKTNVKLLLWALAVVPFVVVAFTMFCVNDQNDSVKQKLGPVELGVMSQILGGSETSEGCVANPIDCKGTGFQFHADCSGCAEVTDGNNPAGMLIGTYIEGTELTCGDSNNKSYNYTESVNCTATSTCVYTQSPATYICYQTQNCSSQGPPCPNGVCYMVSGNSPTQWSIKDIGECLDP
jgi:hypothetical protein